MLHVDKLSSNEKIYLIAVMYIKSCVLRMRVWTTGPKVLSIVRVSNDDDCDL